MSAAPATEPEVVVVPAGDALLGEPPRTEHVNVFAISPRAVTGAEFARFRGGGEAGGGPLLGATWADAVAYCRWLTLGTGRIYRLPDEREWEKAALAGVLLDLGARLEWTNTWAGGRVLRGGAAPARRVLAGPDLSQVGFRVVRGMTGR